jgi:hypothetical protein
METISFSWGIGIIQVLGLSGLIFIVWYFDNKRFARMAEQRDKEIQERSNAIALILSQYKEDVSAVRRLYENNVGLVKEYQIMCTKIERLFGEVLSVVQLNTQTYVQLRASIDNNLFCPIARESKNK